MMLQAQSEVAQLQEQLLAAVSQQEALHKALHEMQATIAVLRDQIQHQADRSACPEAAQDNGLLYARAGNDVSHMASPSTSELVQALQQQVTDLKAISFLLDTCQHQQHPRQPVLRSASLGGQHTGSRSSARGGSILHGSSAQKHECRMPPRPPRSLPSRRLPMSAYASPAGGTQSHQTDAIKAHHSLQQHSASAAAAAAGPASSSDTCWCGRPKMLSGSVVNTPVRQCGYGDQGLASQWHGQQEGYMPSSTATPVKGSARSAKFSHTSFYSDGVFIG